MRHVPPRTHRSPRLAAVASLAVGLLAVTALPAASASPAAEPSIGVLIRGTCVFGRDYQNGGALTVVQKRNGNPISTANLPTVGSDWTACVKPILPGDQLVVTETVGATVVSDRTIAVPTTLSVVLDAATDVETVHAPQPGSLVNYGVIPTVAGLRTYEITKGANTDLSGNFTDDWTGLVDVRAGDVAKLAWVPVGSDRWIITVATPSVGVQVGKAAVAGTGPYGSVTTTIRTASGAVRGTATGAVKGTESAFQATFRSGGKAVKVKVGDRIRSSGIAGSYTVRASDLVVKKAGNGSLTATCAKGSDYAIFINGVWSVSGMSGKRGAISNTNVNNGRGPLFVGSEIKLACRLPSGFGQIFAVKVK